MSIFEILIVGIGLAMDAFAVAICKGLSMNKLNLKNMLIIALYFGVFQAFMPIIGYLLGTTFQSFVANIDHWVVFVLLLIIGGNMIKESFDEEEEKRNDKVDFKTMLLLAIATSIDALAVGITFAFLQVNIFLAVCIIGIVTFFLSLFGVKLGNEFGDRYQNKAEMFGGVVLILIGFKILLEHLGIL